MGFRVAASRRELVGGGDPLRGRSRLYLEHLRAQVRHRFTLARHRRRHGDMVMEEPIPDLSTILMLFGEMVPAQRPLRPVRAERKRVLMQDLGGQEDIKVLLTVVRAYDVPVRRDGVPVDPGLGRQHQFSGSRLHTSSAISVRDSIGEATVSSYIEARLQVG